MGFPKIWRTFLGVPIIRILVYWGLYWGPLIFGKLPYGAIASAATEETLALEKQGTTGVAVGTGANSA